MQQGCAPKSGQYVEMSFQLPGLGKVVMDWRVGVFWGTGIAKSGDGGYNVRRHQEFFKGLRFSCREVVKRLRGEVVSWDDGKTVVVCAS